MTRSANRARLSYRDRQARRLSRLLAVLIMVTAIPAAISSPSDLTQLAAPAMGSDPPKAQDIATGDSSVATQTGSLNYQYPIRIPAGRNGMTPALGLAYSSQGPIYGTLASGWQLGGLEEIRWDTSKGRLRYEPQLMAAEAPANMWHGEPFVSTMSGGRPLVNVAGDPMDVATVFGVYRSQNDAGFVRYQRMKASEPFRWRALTPDGVTHEFGHQDYIAGVTAEVLRVRAPLTRSYDGFNNEVRYFWRFENDELLIDYIVYTVNENAGVGVAPFARIEFVYGAPTLCEGVPVGSQSDYKTGVKLVDGRTPLIRIDVKALGPGGSTEHTRQITLGYFDSGATSTQKCDATATHAPYRQLASIQESAWHAAALDKRVDLPAILFEYGSATLDFNDVATTVTGSTPNWNSQGEPGFQNNLGWGHRFNGARWPSVEATILDLDGDGRLDRLYNATEIINGKTECAIRWSKQDVDGTFDPQPMIVLPRLPWKDNADHPLNMPSETEQEGCHVNYQRTLFQNVDIEAVYGGSCGPAHLGSYLTYRWFDATGDGKPDLVTAIHHDAWFDPALPGPPMPGAPWPTCPEPRDGACPALDYACMEGGEECPLNQPCVIKPNRAAACMAQATNVPCHDMTAKVGRPGTWSEPCATISTLDEPTNVACPEAPLLPPPCLGTIPTTIKPFFLSCNLYPWTIYPIDPTGTLGTPQTLLQPQGLESDTGDSSISGAFGFMAGQKAVLDIDGDGIADMLFRGRWQPDEPYTELPIPIPNAYWWWGYLGDGNGGFQINPTTDVHIPSLFHVPPGIDYSSGAWISRNFVHPTEWWQGGLYEIYATQQLTDVNGDGAADFLNTHEDFSGGVKVYFNDGLKFRNLGGADGAEGLLALPVASLSRVRYTEVDTTLGNAFLVDGERFARTRLVDVDADGRVDATEPVSSEDDDLEIRFNFGGSLLPPDDAVDNGMSRGLEQRMLVDGATGGWNTHTWQVKRDVIDLDGDGLIELVDFDQLTRKRHLHAGKPPRLLTTIKNGRGAETNILYAAMTDDSVVKMQTRRNPRTGWVVKSIETADDFESSTGITSYEYFDPVFNRDDAGRYAFRGFEEVRTTGPRGSQTIQRYGFGEGCSVEGACDLSQDWSGRLVATLTKLSATSDHVHSISEQTWELRELFVIAFETYAIQTYHPAETTGYQCRNDQTEAQCKADPAGLTYSKTTWVAKEGTTTGVPLMHVELAKTAQDNVGDMDHGDRKTETTSVLCTEGGVYRLRPTTIDSHVNLLGANELYASSETVWDATCRLPLEERTRLDSAGTMTITRRTFDDATGNVLTVQKPQQVFEDLGAVSVNTYDARKLFVASVTNEEDHVLEAEFDLGTGAQTSERGPNSRQCTTNCPPDPPEEPLPVMEELRTTIDGLGRPVELEVTVPYGGGYGSAYKFSLVETFSYVDSVIDEAPTSVTNKKRIQHDESRWTEVKTELDGHGRPTKTIEEVYGTAPVDAVTAFDYDVDGTLIAVSVPDPSQNDASQVTFTYTFDALGRPTGMRRPDHPDPAQRTGISVLYDGLEETREEIVAFQGGLPAKTKLLSDAYGRLVKVSEKLAGETWAETDYAYSPRDEVSWIRDPQGDITMLEHDLAGRRTKISRGVRFWKYGYDHNGNRTSETSPVPNQDPLLELAYTTFYEYDDLDRMIQKEIAPRDLGAADRELFGATTLNLDWDQSVYNRMGQIAYFNRRGPANQNVYNGRFYYDVEANPTVEDRNFKIDGVTFPERGETYTWHAFHKLKSVRFADGLLGIEGDSTAATLFDDRGNPERLVLGRPGIGANTNVAVQTRNVAGLVTKRRTDQTGQAMTFIESNWAYDTLGRVTNQVVQQGPGPTLVASQALTYFGNDDPATLLHRIGPTGQEKHFDFEYDARHQLIDVDETAAGGAFSGTYSYGDAGRFERATVGAASLPGGEVRTRDVDFVYGPPDPELLVELRINGTTDPYATYQYDEAGNQTRREYFRDAAGNLLAPTQVWTFLYDGENTLRRATAPDGSVEEYWYDQNAKRALIRKTPSGGGSPTFRMFHAHTETEWSVDAGVPVLGKTFGYASLGTPVARIQNRNNRTEFQFHGLANSTLATVESGVGVIETGEGDDPTSPASGTINAAFTYSPWGEVIETLGAEPAAHQRRLNDKFHDASTGLAYYGFRYYDQVSMTWTQSDPLYRFMPDAAWTESRRANLYSFSLNNPNRYLDPDGRDGRSLGEVAESLGPISFIDCNMCQAGTIGMIAHKPETARNMVKYGPTIIGGFAAYATIAVLGVRAGIAAIGRATAPPADVVAVNAAATATTTRAAAGVGTVALSSADDLASGAAQTAAKIHGNSKLSTKPHHRYIIKDKNGDVVKTGISGGPLNKNGTSPRANKQVNQLNKAEGAGSYTAEVVETSLPGRVAGEAAEQAATTKLHAEGHTLRLQEKPKP